MSEHSFDYDRSYMPSAPVVPITIDGYDPAFPPIQTTAFIDSGADGTMLPEDILQRVHAKYTRSKRLTGVTGEGRVVHQYLVSITIGNIVVTGINAVAMPVGSECILGRDVLNQLQVTLDGFALEVRVWDYND